MAEPIQEQEPGTSFAVRNFEDGGTISFEQLPGSKPPTVWTPEYSTTRTTTREPEKRMEQLKVPEKLGLGTAFEAEGSYYLVLAPKHPYLEKQFGANSIFVQKINKETYNRTTKKWSL